ncbi:MAG: ABC transporter ATP-binding protein [Desulfobacterales bacterium]|nr:ABC transporter ATP-binding protein [Desulfobacterales bacterium]
MAETPLLEIRNLTTTFSVRGLTAKAVDDVSLSILPGQTLGLVGESGCGKSVTAHSIMRLIPSPPGRIAAGEIRFEGQDLAALSEARMRRIRGNRISMIFQEPMTSLNPTYPVGDQVGEVIRLHAKLSRAAARERSIEMFKLVGIPAAEKRIDDYPHQMSGGMRQRVMIAMALACNPQLMIADEPTTAAQILELMNRLKAETGAAILFITHDLGVIAEMSQHVAVMYAGRMMEYADARTLFADPKNPYTVGLLGSIPVLGRRGVRGRLRTIPGMVPSLLRLPEGCLFSDRCPDVFDDCRLQRPLPGRVRRLPPGRPAYGGGGRRALGEVPEVCLIQCPVLGVKVFGCLGIWVFCGSGFPAAIMMRQGRHPAHGFEFVTCNL